MYNLVCFGYFPGEVLPCEDEKPALAQISILDYLDRYPTPPLLLRDAYEINPYLGQLDRSMVEVVGAWHHSCVFRGALAILRSGVPILICPSMTLRITEVLYDSNPREEEMLKRGWLMEYIKKEGFFPRVLRNNIYCKPVE